MKSFVAASVMMLGSFAAVAANAATLATFGNPWGEIATVESAMDGAFGAGGWTLINPPADVSFLTGESFVYFEGGDDTTDAMEVFLNTYVVELLAWVSAGGRMLINAAPNTGDGLAFGGLSLSYLPGPFCSDDCVPTDPAHPIFAGISETSFGGSSFSHGTVSGGSSIITDNGTGDSLLDEITIGSGLLLMGTMTTTNFHFFGEAEELRTAIIGYTAGVDIVPAPIPVPAAGFLLISAVGGLAMLRRRRMAA